MAVQQPQPQQPQPQPQQPQPQSGADAPAGSIASVVLTDFMIHARLELALNPGANFITGANGSGKSAILHALRFALVRCVRARLAGVRVARATRADWSRRRMPPQSSTETGGAQRGRQLIRSGAQTASVVVRLHNRGPEAYRTEDFGDTIVVERSLSAVRARPRPAGSPTLHNTMGPWAHAVARC